VTAPTQSTICASPIGPLRIVGNEQGILAVDFLDANAARSDVQTSIPACLQACVEQLDAYFQGTLRAFSVSLLPHGTPFEQRVWAELLKIPYGETRSYGNIAVALGDPKTVRAVGRANGRNPIAILIPCHRVIGSHGDLTGYGGGLWRKEWLLAHEGHAVQPRLL
jgi:methylated-DNA-[protein]-cysteine S-methyltransferase